MCQTSISLAQPAPPSLNDLQRQHLQAVEDGKKTLDEGFYSLMDNATKWDFALLPAAPKLNVKALAQSPGEYRGGLFEIEGEFLGLYPEYQNFRLGPWTGKVEQWTLREAETNDMIVVYLVGPPPFPTVGTRVKTVGRFYRIWPNSDPSVQQDSFLVFVGRTAEVHYDGALPPLSRTQRIQVDIVEDFTVDLQKPAFFQLLTNASTWPDEITTQPPLITHTAPLIASPKEYRAAVLRVEGILAGRRPIKTDRSGPWDKKLEQWTVRITELNDERDESVVVYLTDPPADLVVGDRVSMVGRFYQIWRDERANMAGDNFPFNFVVLVGKSANKLTAITRGNVSSNEWAGSGSAIQYAIIALAIVGFGLFMVRRHMQRMRAGGPADIVEARRQARIEQRQLAGHASTNGDGQQEEHEVAEELPEDPVDALDELERRGLSDE